MRMDQSCALILAVILLLGCQSFRDPIKTYSGPELPKEQVATLVWSRTVVLHQVRRGTVDQGISWQRLDLQDPVPRHPLSLLPGFYQVTWTQHRGWALAAVARTAKFKAEAGHKYGLSFDETKGPGRKHVSDIAPSYIEDISACGALVYGSRTRRWELSSAGTKYPAKCKPEENSGGVFSATGSSSLTIAQWKALCRQADRGDGAARSAIGTHFRYGWSPVQRDLAKAHMWYSLAMQAGYSDAAGYRRDVAEEMSADQISQAQRLLASWKPLMCRINSALTPAMNWKVLCRQADRGDGAARSVIGSHFRYGWPPVEQDLMRAHMWYSLGLLADYSDAAKYRREISHEMSADQISRAYRLLADWKPGMCKVNSALAPATN
jgi:hypothetical protein